MTSGPVAYLKGLTLQYSASFLRYIPSLYFAINDCCAWPCSCLITSDFLSGTYWLWQLAVFLAMHPSCYLSWRILTAILVMTLVYISDYATTDNPWLFWGLQPGDLPATNLTVVKSENRGIPYTLHPSLASAKWMWHLRIHISSMWP